MNKTTPDNIRKHGYLMRHGLPTMTRSMMQVLIRLRENLEIEEPFEKLDDIDERTVKSLLSRAWIGRSARGPALYKITDQGLNALKIYERPALKRTDGLCPRCGINPPGLRSTGKKRPYCLECESKMSKRKRLLGIQDRNPDAICYQCKERPVYISPNGKIGSLCRECKNAEGRRRHKQQREEYLRKVQAGEQLPCIKDGCTNPRHVYGKTVSDFCHRHWREYMAEYNDRRRPESITAKLRHAAWSANEAFEHYPHVGTIEHLPSTTKNGQRYYNALQVRKFAGSEVPRDLITCECGSKKHVVIEMVCPEGYAIYRCGKCQRCFRIVMEYDYFFQEVVSEAI